ncbi:hypothetical protein JR316_0012068 [Psilocybe cubensis]|uniref:Uncharacterized protein n=2 Tax=Psilocybe cubensis TaxID=181762 RepID=A0ACB8GH89_PSICU|nr:hypothetical protein JR316_0012068 [Psilocybe cubensis]KAH9474969.1 hypothetical protein JR316_0012068 [Psilocybe cubensis]
MDFVKNQLGGQNKEAQATSGAGGGLTDKVSGALGGGQAGEKNEGMNHLNSVDFVQERFLGAGPQNNESAIEQAKDEQISDVIRRGYKSATGTDFPIKDK